MSAPVRARARWRRELRAVALPRTRVGLAVASDSVRAVAVRRGRLLWALEGALTPGEPLDRAIVQLLERAPLSRWPRPIVSVAVGPSLAQTKRLAGLPALAAPRTLAQLVDASAGRFFLKNGVPLVTSGVRIDGPGVAWAAAIDEPAVLDVERACRTLRLPLRHIVPATAVVGRVIAGDSVVWCDGETVARLTFREGALVGLRRFVEAEALPSCTLRPGTPLAAIGAHAARYAAAYAAALLDRHEPLALRCRSVAREREVPRWRIGIAAAALALSVVALLVGPGIAARRAARGAEERLATLANRRAAAIRLEGDVAQVSAALAEVGAFASGRSSRTTLLAALTGALPAGSALTALRVDSVGGSLVALAPRAAAVLGALERVPGVSGPEIVGPVTKEVAGGREVERVTVRFRILRRPPAMTRTR